MVSWIAFSCSHTEQVVDLSMPWVQIATEFPIPLCILLKFSIFGLRNMTVLDSTFPSPTQAFVFFIALFFHRKTLCSPFLEIYCINNNNQAEWRGWAAILAHSLNDWLWFIIFRVCPHQMHASATKSPSLYVMNQIFITLKITQAILL